ncbi:MAG: hypothetical protein AM325_005935 [Candidatus Thorarchaeota archaeon SMTZ1-45]|nr:MAG: hypothetical protein AM325_07685 [Candidatus Thorarchaeota archaeon SMTZ1-45]
MPTGRTVILCILVICCLVFCESGEVTADLVEDMELLTINPGEYHNVSLYFTQDELLYARFRIIDGEGIYFFIVDQAGQDAIMNGSEPTTKHEDYSYPAQEGRLNMVFFQATHSDTWYVWFSKVSGVPFADSAATIEGRVGRDIEGPVIQETHIPDGPLTGITNVSFRVHDEGFFIYMVELHANDTVVATSSFNCHETIDINGTTLEGVLLWDTTRYENSVYVLKVVVYDPLNHVTESAEVLRTINNGFWDYPTNRIIVTAGIILFSATLTVYSYAQYKKIRITRHYVKRKIIEHRTWLEIILILIILLILGLSSSIILL